MTQSKKPSHTRTTRKANGEGSIYKYRGRYRWQLREQLGGQTKTVSSGIEDTKTAARLALARAIADRDRGLLLVSTEEVNVGEWLNRWLRLRKPHIQATTYDQYDHRLRAYVPEQLKEMPLNKVKRAHILELELSLCDRISASTRKKVMEHLSAAFQEAVHQELLVRNPADRIKVTPTQQEKERPKRRKALSDGEMQRFLEAAEGDALYPLFYLLFSLGLRCGEALGLRWEDVDFANCEIRIRQANKLLKNKPVLGVPKTAASVRDIPASSDLLEILQAHRQRQDAQKADFGTAWVHRELVFTTGIGSLLDRHNVMRKIHRICAETGIERFGTHSGRHTVITNLLRAGHLPEVVMRVAGHTRTVTTMGYRTVMPEEIRAAQFSLRSHLALADAAD